MNTQLSQLILAFLNKNSEELTFESGHLPSTLIKGYTKNEVANCVKYLIDKGYIQTQKLGCISGGYGIECYVRGLTKLGKEYLNKISSGS